MLTSTITQKGQVTIPKKIRDELNMKTNDQVIFVRRGNSIILKPVRDILNLRGTIQTDNIQNFTKIRSEVQNKITGQIANE